MPVEILENDMRNNNARSLSFLNKLLNFKESNDEGNIIRKKKEEKIINYKITPVTRNITVIPIPKPKLSNNLNKNKEKAINLPKLFNKSANQTKRPLTVYPYKISISSATSTVNSLSELSVLRPLTPKLNKEIKHEVVELVKDVDKEPNNNKVKKLFYHRVRIIISLLHLVKFLSKRPRIMMDRKSIHSDDVSEVVKQTFVPLNDAYDNLVFNKDYFKAKKRTEITKELRYMLTLLPEMRTEDQIKSIRIGLQTISSYIEYPIHIQEKIARCGFYQRLQPKHVIIRQGQVADSFYFIINGQAMVTVLEKNSTTGEFRNRVIAVLKAGSSFGELAFLYNSARTATVTSLTDMELISIGREDFFKIFVTKRGELPEHFRYLKKLEFMKDWPIEKLIENPQECLFHYYKRDQVILQNVKDCDWIYVVKSGQCQVVRKVQSIRPNSIYIKPRDSKLNFLDDRKSKIQSGLKSTTFSSSSLNQWPITATTSTFTNFSTTPKYTYIQMQKLKSGDTFGLNTLNFNDGFDSNVDNDDLDEISLISNGAEIIMINKTFYTQNANSLVKNCIRTKVDPLPDIKQLEEKLKILNSWKAYKNKALIDAYKFKRS